MGGEDNKICPKKKFTKKDKHNQTWICGPFCSLVHIYCIALSIVQQNLGIFFCRVWEKAAKASIKKIPSPILYNKQLMAWWLFPSW
jgi:hypothetical protein